VESLFTTSLHISDFVQTRNEAKILTVFLLKKCLTNCFRKQFLKIENNGYGVWTIVFKTVFTYKENRKLFGISTYFFVFNFLFYEASSIFVTFFFLKKKIINKNVLIKVRIL
jgi:hypothetical protein